MKKIILTLCLVALTLQLKVSVAFWSDPFYGTHQDITTTALSLDVKTSLPPFCFTADNCYAFSAKAITQINKRHGKQDAGILNKVGYGVAYDPQDHFDSNLLAASLTKMAVNRGQLNSLLKAGNFPPTVQAQMWALLGNMLHAAEDFYAHSTWVDEGNSGNSIIGFGAATENTSKPNLTIFPFTPVVSFCSPAGYPLSTLPVSYLITGYYPPNNPPVGGCEHGATFPSLFSIIINQPSPSLFGLCDYLGTVPLTVPGISHDVACSGNFLPTDTELLHQIAYSLAVQEAQSFVQSIVADMVTLNNAAGFCALLGLPSNTQISTSQKCGGPILSANPSWVVSGATVTFSVVEGPPSGSLQIPTGSAAIIDETGTTVCTVTLNSTGTGTCTYVYPSTIQHTYIAAYSGDSSFNGDTSPAINTSPYAVSQLAAPGGFAFSQNSDLRGVNSGGDVVGLACTMNQCGFPNSTGYTNEAFIYHQGQYFDLNALAPSASGFSGYTSPTAMSESGSILTLKSSNAGSPQALLLTRTNSTPLTYSAAAITAPSGFAFSQNSDLRGVNSSGDVVGLACTMSQCGFPNSTGYTNEAFIYHQGQYFDLNALAPSASGFSGYTSPTAMSESGSILTLKSSNAGSPQALLLTRTNSTPLTYSAAAIAAPSGYSFSQLSDLAGVNSSGDVVGLACTMSQCGFPNSTGYTNEAFIYHQGQYFDLNLVAPSVSGYSGYTSPTAMSESGSILTLKSSNAGSPQAFLLAAPYLPTFSIVVTISGLNGSLGLQNNNGTPVLTSGIAATTIVVLPAVPSGSGYSITVAFQPSNQTCSVSNGSGFISGALVTNVTVTCN
jgi:hypothetical protein